ncbi:von Willebrand factor A domain-containing protein 7-like [Mytilus californianus]|uniref:von Willebrand factor A domain-containing protein 7-like n=1 Tax=Mytilus californianus TaxID=6549 RepID=UPI0022478811|nr:von Willebrand factor A domain-containing protein 7-like [Mytilus californianus]
MNLLTVFVFTSSVSAFYPRQPPPADWRTKTHFDITVSGTLRAISTYIFNRNMTNATSSSSALDEFFGTDHNGWTAMLTTINTVRESVADTQEEKRGIPYVHCHADQIKLAHTHLIACRDKLSARKDDINELQKQIGECLYTIQSFYSNTNWVEMFGKTPYLDFGVKGMHLMRVATSDDDTCLDMENSLVSCKDNLLVTNMLTSGFHHGRGNLKPARPKNALKGKCSHGGLDDESRNLIAKCGINKETTVETLSPHYHLHGQAYEAAVEATKQFLIAEDTGILNILGDDLFKSLFEIKQRTQVSLSFAVDFSGSMGGEIAAVKEQIIQLVTSTIGSNNEPADYVLSLFNDPASLNEAFVYTSGQDMIDKIANIRVDGGGDCPEYAAAGILKAIELSKPRSTVIVFTDADAKDADRLQEVTDAALAKNIPITSVLSSQCSSRKRRDTHDRRRRETQLFFQSLSHSTGGTLYNTDKDTYGSVLTEVVKVMTCTRIHFLFFLQN